MKMLKKIFFGACVFGLIGAFGFNVDAKAATEVTVDGDTATVTWDDSVLSANKVVYYWGSNAPANKLDEVSVSGVSSNSISGLKDKVLNLNTGVTTDSIEGKNVVVEVLGVTNDTATSTAKTGDLYKLTVSVASSSNGKGTVAIDGAEGNSKFVYDYAGSSHTIAASGDRSGSTVYSFDMWTLAGSATDLNYSSSQVVTITTTVANNKYEAHFDKAVESATLTVSNGTSSSTSSLSVTKGTIVTFSASRKPSGAKYSRVDLYIDDDDDIFEEVSATKYKAVAKGTAYATVTITNKDGSQVESNTVTLKVTDGGSTGSFTVAPSSGNDYITKDKPIELKATNTSGTVTWSASGVAGSFSSTTGTTVTYTPSATGTLKITATDDSGSAVMNDITVYDKPTLTYNNRALEYKAPAKVYTGTETGVDSDNKDNTKDAIDSVTGVKLQVFFDGNSLGTTSTAKSSGPSATISASTVETLILNLKDKFSKSGTVTFRAYPCDSDGKYNKNIYAEATAQLYKISVIGTGITTESFYGLSGQSLSIKATPTTGSWAGYWDDDKTITTQTRTVTVDGEKTYTAVLDSVAASKTSGEAYDAVPRTGENNSGVLGLIAILILGAAAGGYYFYKFLGKKSF